MELTPRKKAILEAVVNSYVLTGEPVGSKALAAAIENSPSSATIRNEMNELCSLGLLFQPHVSAGRVPTSLGFKVYVSSIMRTSGLDERTKRYLDNALNFTACDSSSVLSAASKALNRIFGLPSVYSFISDENAYLKTSKLFMLSKKAAAIIAVSSDGRFISRVIRITAGNRGHTELLYRKLFEEKLRNKKLSDFSKAGLQNFIACLNADEISFIPVLSELFDMIASGFCAGTEIFGTESLYNLFPENEAVEIQRLFAATDPLDAVNSKSNVVFGSDMPFKALYNKAFVVADYYTDNKHCGKIGVLGPDRMSYGQIIPAVRYASEILSGVLSIAAKDMEE